MTSKPSKYRNVKTEVDGITFASKLEAKRYGELKLLERAGEIEDLELQPVFALDVVRYSATPPIHSPTTALRVGKYKADFQYHRKDRWGGFSIRVIEDVKGMKTPLYKWKKKHFEAQYGLVITEITK